MKVLLLFIGVAICFADRGKAENLRLKKTNAALRQALQNLQKSPERAVGEWKDSEGNSYCDQINDDNKSKKCFSYHIYLLGVKCDICRGVAEKQVGSEKHYVGFSPFCTCGMCYDGCCPCGGSAEDEEKSVGSSSIFTTCKDQCERDGKKVCRIGTLDHECPSGGSAEDGEEQVGEIMKIEERGSEKHWVGFSPFCTCGMCYDGCCPCGGSAEDEEENVGAVASRGGRCGAGKVWNGHRCVASFHSEEQVGELMKIEERGSEKHWVGFSPFCTCGMCYDGCCPCGGSAEDEEAKVAYDAGRVVKGPSNKRCPCGHCGARGCCRCAEEEIAERGAAHYGRERTQDSSLTSTYTERPRGPRFSHEKAVGRMYKWEESEMCIEECGRRDPSDYERCKNFCVESELEKEKAVARGRHAKKNRRFSHEKSVARGRHAKKRRRFSHEKAVARADRPDEEEMCIRECGRRDPNDYERCKNSCVRDYGRQEKAVGGSWENGKCMSYGSYLTDAGATVNDMGTGWSESSCQSECDYSSTTKACQYEFSSQKCLMIGFYTNEIYGAGDYDALCYVK